MFKAPSLLFAAIILTSAPVLAADTPDPNATNGAAALPSGSNANAPANNPAGNSAMENKPELQAPATTPGEENKGKPPIKVE
jgi:hypothetical protein